MKNFIILLILQTFLFSCQQKVDSAKTKQFAQTIHDYTHGQIKGSQQGFVDKLTENLQSLQQNNDAVIDTKELRELLDKAKQANQLSFQHIKNTTEIDNEINLRQKALDENDLFKSLYENEFTKTIEILESKDKNKLEEISKLLTDKKEEEIKKVQSDAKEADYEFTNKYNISFPEDSTK
jgi:hypothetical protein